MAELSLNLGPPGPQSSVYAKFRVVGEACGAAGGEEGRGETAVHPRDAAFGDEILTFQQNSKEPSPCRGKFSRHWSSSPGGSQTLLDSPWRPRPVGGTVGSADAFQALLAGPEGIERWKWRWDTASHGLAHGGSEGLVLGTAAMPTQSRARRTERGQSPIQATIRGAWTPVGPVSRWDRADPLVRVPLGRRQGGASVWVPPLGLGCRLSTRPRLACTFAFMPADDSSG